MKSFDYTITAHSPEIRKDMVWLDHDKAGMQLLFNNLPRHISDHSPLTRHAIVYTVEYAAEQRQGQRGIRTASVQDDARRRRDGALRGRALPRYRQASTQDRPGCSSEWSRLETRQFGFGYHIPF